MHFGCPCACACVFGSKHPSSGRKGLPVVALPFGVVRLPSSIAAAFLFPVPCPYHVRGTMATAGAAAAAGVVGLGRNGAEGSPPGQSAGRVNSEGACGSLTRPRDGPGWVSGEGSVRGLAAYEGAHPSIRSVAYLRCVAPAGDPRSSIDADEGGTDEIVALDEPGRC